MSGISSSLKGPIDIPRRWLASRSKAALAVSAAIGVAIFWCLGRWFDIPAERHFQASLMVQPSPIVALFITFVGLIATCLLIRALQGSDDPTDAVFAAAAGLAALSWRGGPMTDVLQNAKLSVFLAMDSELILLAAMLYGCWWLLRRIGPGSGPVDTSEWSERLPAAGVAIAVTFICMYLLSQTDAKKQALASVGISSFVGAAAAYSLFEMTSVELYVAAPFVCGLIGYLLAYFNSSDWHIGRTGQPLAYPLPLDYASMGPVGALLGYWTALKWKHES